MDSCLAALIVIVHKDSRNQCTFVKKEARFFETAEETVLEESLKYFVNLVASSE